MTLDTQIVEIDFSTIKPIWQNHLWDSRYQFEEVSCMLLGGGYNAEIRNLYKPKFLSIQAEGKIAAVLSGHATSNEHYRTRGLYVFPDYRRLKLPTLLIQYFIDEARSQGYKLIWSVPRVSALELYTNLGFLVKSRPTTEGFLYGPNQYVSLSL